MVKVLFTSITKPVGIDCNDLTEHSSYEHFYTHIMREQGIFAIRTQYDHWPLDLIAANINVPTTVLHWPTRSQLYYELKTGNYDIVAIPVVDGTFERAENDCNFIRSVDPNIKVIYGLHTPEKGHADKVIIGEGVYKFRKFLGEKHRGIYHPLMYTIHTILGQKLIGKSGVILEKLGCDNPIKCHNCSTGNVFPEPVYFLNENEFLSLIKRYNQNQTNNFIIFNEDHLRNINRNKKLHNSIRSLDSLLEFMCFSCMDSVMQYKPEDLFDIGYHTIWVGLEDFSCDYKKNDYSKVNSFIDDMRKHGISLIISSLIGTTKQNIIDCKETIDKVINLNPYANQINIVVPFMDTPFSKIVKINEPNYRFFDTHHLVFEHPTIYKSDLEKLQIKAQKRDYYELGPSVLRAVETLFEGYKTFRSSKVNRIKNRVKKTSLKLKSSLSMLDLVTIIHPNNEIREKAKELKSKIIRQVFNSSIQQPNLFSIRLLGWIESFKLHSKKLLPSILDQPETKRNVYNQ
tara:strand:+ start:54 stop:1598 length:1545 start_codon:yes stop_codon:yes gene_type:complete